jgi:hypothetical protein
MRRANRCANELSAQISTQSDEGSCDMGLKDKARIQAEAREEAHQDEEQELRLEQRVQKWKRGAALLGVALIASIIAVVPFLYGYPLHNQWDVVGKKLILLSMCLLCAFMYTVATTYNLWSYLRVIKGIHRKFAPPGSKYRTSK